MTSGATQRDAGRISDRIEVILRQLNSLPTLGVVAVRLLALTASDDADAGEVIQLVSSDPALASRVITMCRCHDRGRASQVTTVDRAVLLLGFEAVRNAVLSVQVFELLDGMTSPSGETCATRPAFDRAAFWLHSLAVAVAAEQIAHRGRLVAAVNAGEAYMAGLLHDIGQLVLHVLLPESFDRVCRVAETHSASLDHACRQVIGIDTHTAGKRLAETWGLPASLVDTIWMTGQPHAALPNVPHRDLITVVSLADALVRSRYINPGAHWSLNDDIDALAVPVGVSSDDLDAIALRLPDEVGSRATALGLDETHEPAVLLRLVCRANESLARANTGMRQRERLARRQQKLLDALAAFHDPIPARCSVLEVLGRIASSAAAVFDAQVPAAVCATADGAGWRLVRFSDESVPVGICPIDADESDPLRTLGTVPGFVPASAVMPWLGEHIDTTADPGRVRMLQLAPGPPDGAVLIVRSGDVEPRLDEDARGLIACWCAAFAAAMEHDRAGLLGERLAEANRALLDTQEALARSRTTSTLGEVAAGAAHEMNNPLTVISGRSQLLASRVHDPEHRDMALEIVDQAHQLSDMITSLRSFAEPVEPQRRPLDLADLVVRAVQGIDPDHRSQVQVSTVFAEPLPLVYADGELISTALAELVRNATQSKGVRHIDLRVQTEPLDDRLKIEVRDDGEGLDEHTLRHAFDPFFSARPAGRQAGLGLARARRFVEAHGGQVTLVNGASGGAVAAIWLRNWRADEGEDTDGHEPDQRDAARAEEPKANGNARERQHDLREPGATGADPRRRR